MENNILLSILLVIVGLIIGAGIVFIINLIKIDGKVSTEQMSKILEVRTRTIKRHIKEMNNIKYIGSGYSGHWEIL